MKILHFILSLFISSFAFSQQIDTTEQIIEGRVNAASQQAKPYVILISVDGLRNDLVATYNASTIQRLASQGVSATHVIPSYPTLTFPNHYSIVTGLYPIHHGIVNNTFYDPARKKFYSKGNTSIVTDGNWYGGTPLWVLSEQQQLLSACFYWVGSEADIQNTLPTYYFKYNEKIDIDTRIATVKKWLQLPEEKRPHLITFYLPQVDHELHSHGIGSEQSKKAVQFVDESIGKLVASIDSLRLPVNYILVSDHGMTNVSKDKEIHLPQAIDTSTFFVVSGSALLQLYGRDLSKKEIKKAYKAIKKEAKDYTAYLSNRTPKRWHFRKKDDAFNRMGDIILVADPPAYFHLGKMPATNIGYHGFDNKLKDMYASFYAWGPAFKNKLLIKGFENVHIYPLVAEILGLTYDFKIDGKLKVLEGILKK